MFARPVDQIRGRVVDRWIAFENLLIGGGIDHLPAFDSGLRRAAPIVDDGLDRRAVKRQQRLQPSAAIALHVERWRVDDEKIFEDQPQPIGKSMLPVGPPEEWR